MTTITSTQGLVDDGSGNLTVAGSTITNISYMTPNALPGSASFGSGWPTGPAQAGGTPGGLIAIPTPGFYQVPVSGSGGGGSAGMGGFTGSLPSAATFPGGEILITDTSGKGWSYLITGSMSVMQSLTGSSGAGIANAVSINGSKLTVSTGGTVGFWSDSKGWLVCAVSGTLILNP